MDLQEVKGQAIAKRALEVAAVGGHNVLIVGPSGTGKSMLLSRYGTIDPTIGAAYTVPLISSITTASELKEGFRNVSITPRFLLRLEDVYRVNPAILSLLREKMEAGRCQLLAEMAFCKCGGMSGDGFPDDDCTCNREEVSAFLTHFRETLYGRFDIVVETTRLRHDEALGPPGGEYSAHIQNRVSVSRDFHKYRKPVTILNSAGIPMECPDISPDALTLLRAAYSQLHYNGRQVDQVLRVSRSIADLAREENIGIAHIAEAVQYSFSNGLRKLFQGVINES